MLEAPPGLLRDPVLRIRRMLRQSSGVTLRAAPNLALLTLVLAHGLGVDVAAGAAHCGFSVLDLPWNKRAIQFSSGAAIFQQLDGKSGRSGAFATMSTASADL